jgi:hypothetical protein
VEKDPDSICPVEPFGATALLLGCVGLLTASIRLLASGLIPLSLAGLVCGMVGIVRAWRTGRFRFTFPIAGSALAGAVLLLGLCVPSWLGPAFDTAPARQPDPERQGIFRMVLGNEQDTGPDDPVWANARRYALCQEHLTVQIVEVTRSARKLDVRIRISGDSAAGLLKEQHQPTLTDATGKTARPQRVRVESADKADEATSGSRGEVNDIICTFELAGRDLPTLHLEIPAAGCGGTGVFRFALPPQMVKGS